MKRKRGMKVSLKRRIELIEDLQAMRFNLSILENRIQAAENMLKGDYWTLTELEHLKRFKQRLKD